MLQPQPGQLDQRRAQAWVARLEDALLTADRAALPGRRCEPGIGRDLPAVVEMPKQALRPQHIRKLCPIPRIPSSMLIGPGSNELCCARASRVFSTVLI